METLVTQNVEAINELAGILDKRRETEPEGIPTLAFNHRDGNAGYAPDVSYYRVLELAGFVTYVTEMYHGVGKGSLDTERTPEEIVRDSYYLRTTGEGLNYEDFTLSSASHMNSGRGTTADFMYAGENLGILPYMYSPFRDRPRKNLIERKFITIPDQLDDDSISQIVVGGNDGSSIVVLGGDTISALLDKLAQYPVRSHGGNLFRRLVTGKLEKHKIPDIELVELIPTLVSEETLEAARTDWQEYDHAAKLCAVAMGLTAAAGSFLNQRWHEVVDVPGGRFTVGPSLIAELRTEGNVRQTIQTVLDNVHEELTKQGFSEKEIKLRQDLARVLLSYHLNLPPLVGQRQSTKS